MKPRGSYNFYLSPVSLHEQTFKLLGENVSSLLVVLVTFTWHKINQGGSSQNPCAGGQF